MALFRRVPSTTQVTAFTNNLIELLAAGVLVSDAFLLLASSQTTSEARLARSIFNELMQGRTLAQILKDYPNCFDTLYIHMVDAGFRAGKLASFLTLLVSYRQEKEKNRQDLIRALAYPVFVVFISIALAVVLLVQIVPRFEHLFAASGESLPWLTTLMIALSQALSQHGLLMLGMLVIAALSMRLLCSLEAWQIIWQKLLLHIPLLRGWIISGMKESYFRILATMLQAKLPLTECNRIAAGACSFVQVSRELSQVSDKLVQGQTLDQAWQSLPYFNTADRLAARTGYSGARLDKLILLRANSYQRLMSNRVNLMLRLLEPMLMLVIGAVIGVIVLAIYLPLFNIGQII